MNGFVYNYLTKQESYLQAHRIVCMGFQIEKGSSHRDPPDRQRKENKIILRLNNTRQNDEQKGLVTEKEKRK